MAPVMRILLCIRCESFIPDTFVDKLYHRIKCGKIQPEKGAPWRGN